LWIPLLTVVTLCVPFTLLTMKMTRDGWDQPLPSVAFFFKALGVLAVDHLSLVGGPLLTLAVIGVYVVLFRPLVLRTKPGVFWMCNFVTVIAVVVFHAVVPTSMEVRKLFMSIPSILCFSAAGLNAVLDRLPKSRWAPGFTYPVVAGVLVVTPWVVRPSFSTHVNMARVAHLILGRQLLDRSVVLVSSSSTDEREELSFVAEVAAAEKGSFRHAVLRAGKLVGNSSWLGRGYRLRFGDTQQLSQALREIPVSAIVLQTSGERWNGHSRLIREMTTSDVLRWSREALESNIHGQLELFSLRTQSAAPIRLPPSDLGLKLGRDIAAPF
jgi:hypothetical protein